MKEPCPPTLIDALIPLAVLIPLLALSVNLFGADSSAGPNQLVLLAGAAIAAMVAGKNGHSWESIERAAVGGIATAMRAILILLAVGALIGSWIMAGTVPAMIYYGLKLLAPETFYAVTALICAIASVSIGSSWTVAGTLGVALVGVALGLGLSPAITAGAIVSGAYFGDKMSPLSDTTNLAAAVTEVDLFDHIRHMVWTTGPSFLIALGIFLMIGLGSAAGPGELELSATMATLDGHFRITVLALLPLVVVFLMALRKMPPLPTILLGALLGGLTAVWLQPEVVLAFADAPGEGHALAMTRGVWLALADGYVAQTGLPAVDELLSRGGMASMLTTVWLIICALAFGGIMEHAGLLERLIQSALRAARSTGAFFATIVLTCIGVNAVAADQYIAIVVPGRMYKAEIERRGLARRNLSRVIEDSGTLTSPLVPWNTCGAYMAATLGVATVAYLPFAFFNLINPLVSVLYAYLGISMRPRVESHS
jgi:NhaC family Na+:H+ antiporter